MAVTIERAPDHRNVLLITGDDLYFLQNDDPNVITPLEAASAADSPVTKGSHDFWIVFSVGSTGAANAGGQDPAATPRPLRGAVVAKSPPTTMDLATMTSQVVTLLQEVGHYWLAYTNLKFRWAGQVASYHPGRLAVGSTTKTPFQGPLIGGRTNQHWGRLVHSDGSPMGGQNWTDMTRDGHLGPVGLGTYRYRSGPTPPGRTTCD